MAEMPGIQAKKPTAEFDDGLPKTSSRGDKTAIELFIAGIRGWEAGMRQCLNDGTTSAQ
jgi:hypothetical protein